ncbi:MAG: sigma-70 family RNA polymerase sigma factor [Verrucomicrobia bacterium]|nr:sigma-70 family RNA polymerase sigma factor [Verrucomicrobiota bacterium]
MRQSENGEVSQSDQGGAFRTTRWSLVMSAGDPSCPQATEAMEKLCRAYWYPLYAYLRKQGRNKESAEDLTQGLFARLLRLNSFGQVRPEKGRFRTFLLSSLKNFLSDQYDKERAIKRGGGCHFYSLDDSTAEERYQHEPANVLDPEKLYERRFALALLDQARQRLREEYAGRGKSALYELLQTSDAGGPGTQTYKEIATRLGMTEQAVTSAAFAMRRRFSHLVREEVANTVESPADVDEELRHLITVISG